MVICGQLGLNPPGIIGHTAELTEHPGQIVTQTLIIIAGRDSGGQEIEVSEPGGQGAVRPRRYKGLDLITGLRELTGKQSSRKKSTRRGRGDGFSRISILGSAVVVRTCSYR